MYVRVKLQARAVYNLEKAAQLNFPGMRVTRGYVISDLLSKANHYISNPDILRSAIAESDKKEQGGGTPVNLNLSAEANEKLEELKRLLDKETGRSLFPAQVLDVLLICAATNTTEEEKQNAPNISDAQLAKALLDYAYKLLTEETLSVNMIHAKAGLLTVLGDNRLI